MRAQLGARTEDQPQLALAAQIPYLLLMDRGPKLRRRLEHHLDELPVLPTAVAKLMVLRPEADTYTDDVIHVLESEPNLTARLIARANSAESAPSMPITTLRTAVARLGARTAANLILGFAIARVFIPKDDWEKSLWRHAIQVAVAARALTPHCVGVSFHRDEAYTSGLLHDVGRFVMFQEAPEHLRRIDEGDWTTRDELVASERAICGMTHTELGALACAKWNIPELVTAVVRDHHERKTVSADPRVAKLVELVRFADIAMFPSAVPGTPGWDSADDNTLDQVLRPKLPSFVRLGLSELRDILRSTAAEADALARELGVA